jgi:hypothetical protein
VRACDHHTIAPSHRRNHEDTKASHGSPCHSVTLSRCRMNHRDTEAQRLRCHRSFTIKMPSHRRKREDAKTRRASPRHLDGQPSQEAEPHCGAGVPARIDPDPVPDPDPDRTGGWTLAHRSSVQGRVCYSSLVTRFSFITPSHHRNHEDTKASHTKASHGSPCHSVTISDEPQRHRVTEASLTQSHRIEERSQDG